MRGSWGDLGVILVHVVVGEAETGNLRFRRGTDFRVFVGDVSGRGEVRLGVGLMVLGFWISVWVTSLANCMALVVFLPSLDSSGSTLLIISR